MSAHGEEVARTKLVRISVDRPWRWHIAQTHVLRERRRVDLADEVRMLPQRGQFRAEEKGAVVQTVDERLHAKAVAAEREDVLGTVPNRKREHAHESLHGVLDAPRLEGSEQHLGVRVAVEGEAARGQLLPERLEVVDLSVVDDHVAPRRGGHRLMARGGEVEDREPTVREADAVGIVRPEALVVGASVGDAVGERSQTLGAAFGGAQGFNEAGKSTHI